MSLIDLWTFILTEEPGAPSTPFASGVFFFDIMRLIIIGATIAIILCTPLAVLRSTTLGQKARLIGATLVFVSVFGTELEHFGDYVHWRLYFNFVASVMMAWGYWSMFRFETPSYLKIPGNNGV